MQGIESVVLLSGGMDSATVLARVMGYHTQNPAKILAIGFNYGSKHGMYEIRAARSIAEHYKVHYALFDVQHIFRGFNSSLLKHGGELPHGHYEAETMKQTVVPGRNTIFTAVAAGMAESVGAGNVWLGIHAGDHAIYPDCRPEWLKAMQDTITQSTNDNVWIHAPFLKNSKATILRHGLSIQVPYHLTRTCYADQLVACGKCGSCQERLASFKEAGIEDPLEYESREILPK